MCFFFFFFSSRRRHTRFDCDWSSDVCSSDLVALGANQVRQAGGTMQEIVDSSHQVTAIMGDVVQASMAQSARDRKSTRLNSSHSQISYAVFCLKKKKNKLSHNW